MSLKKIDPTTTAAWKKLTAHFEKIKEVQMPSFFVKDEGRKETFSASVGDINLDYSKNRITEETLKYLIELATEVDLNDGIEQLFLGEKINATENRAVLHTALRNKSDKPVFVEGKDVMPEVKKSLSKMKSFSDDVISGTLKGFTNKAFTDVVNIGIGGSDLGPAMVTRALRAYHHPRLHAHYVSNVDVTHLTEITRELDPETTLFIIASKTFTTQETLFNAYSARDWLLSHFKEDETAIAQHFVALSTNTEKVCEFGINPDNMFEFWDWVGGRYSVWSAVGLSVMIMIGAEQFQQFLAGAHQIDEHFRNTEFSENIPVLMGLISVWYSSFHHAPSHAILPYDFALEQFPAYLQQLIMESLGKSVTESGAFVDYLTCPIIWGATGNNGQHAFYQLLHQGTEVVPIEFIGFMESQYQADLTVQGTTSQQKLVANLFAQSVAFATGKKSENPNKNFAGNRPNSMLIGKKLTPRAMGALLSLYEAKIAFQGFAWNINSFDQEGVQLGKVLAGRFLDLMQGKEAGSKGVENLLLKTVQKLVV